jgi:hypothetical protein
VGEGDVTRSHPPDEELDKSWVREAANFELRFVEAHHWAVEDFWQVTCAVLEFVRDEPLVSELNDALGSALGAVAGVARAWHEDREVWHIDGHPEGRALVVAAADVLDRFESRILEAEPYLRR